MRDLLTRTELYIEEKGLLELPSGFRVVIGVSGGADSVGLLLLFYELAQKYRGLLTVVHVNHNLRGSAADADQKFVEDLCAKLGLELLVFSEAVAEYAKKERMSLEEAGRNLRYRRLTATARQQGAKVAVAHHMDDQAETVLFHLIRGADFNGLAGMRPESEMDGVSVIRPLLFAERTEIEDWLTGRGQGWCTDVTNADPVYARNRIRHGIIKELKEINPGAVQHICKVAELAGGTERFLEAESSTLFARCVSPDAQEVLLRTNDGLQSGLGPEVPQTNSISLDAKLLRQANPLVADRLLFRVITTLCGHTRDITRTHVEDVLRLAAMESGKRIMLPEGVVAVKENDRLRLRKADALSRNSEQKQQVLLNAEPVFLSEDLLKKRKVSVPAADGRKIFFEILELNAHNRPEFIKKNQYTKVFDYDKILGSLFLGTRLPGDRITLENGSKPVNRFFIDEKIPRDDRDTILLLKDEKEVLWIIGYRMNAAYKITENTKTALRVTVAP